MNEFFWSVSNAVPSLIVAISWNAADAQGPEFHILPVCQQFSGAMPQNRDRAL